MGQATDTLALEKLYFFEPSNKETCSNKDKIIGEIWFGWSQQSENSAGSLYIEKAEERSPQTLPKPGIIFWDMVLSEPSLFTLRTPTHGL